MLLGPVEGTPYLWAWKLLRFINFRELARGDFQIHAVARLKGSYPKVMLLHVVPVA